MASRVDIADALAKYKRLVKGKTDIEIIIFLYLPMIVMLSLFIGPLFIIIPETLKADISQVIGSEYYTSVSLEGFNNFVKITNTPKYLRIRINGINMGMIPNSIINATIVTISTTLLGTIVAILVGVYRFPGRRILATLAYIPLLITPFVNAFIIKRYFGVSFHGNTFSEIISIFLEPLLDKKVIIEFSGQAGVSLAQTLLFYPIIYVNVLAALGALDATLIEQALNLGARGTKLLRKIILPLVAPGILAGATLVFILSLEDVGAPIIFKFNKMMAYQIYSYFRGIAADRAIIALLSLIMLIFAVVPLIFVRRYLSLRYYARLARGAPRPFTRLKLGRKGLLMVYLLVFPIVLTAAAPQFGIILLALSNKWVGAFPELLPISEVHSNFVAIFDIDGIARSVYNSVTYLLKAVVFIAVIGFMAGYAVARSRLPGTFFMDTLSSTPLAVPGLVVAFSYYVFFSTYTSKTFLDPTLTPVNLIVLAYVLRKIPFTIRSVFTATIQTPEELEEASRSLGARRIKVIKNIVIPLIWRGIIAGLLLSSIYVLSEVSVSVTLGALKGSIISPDHAGPITFAMLQLVEGGTVIGGGGGTQPQTKAAALAVILMVVEVAVIMISTRFARRGQAIVTI